MDARPSALSNTAGVPHDLERLALAMENLVDVDSVTLQLAD